MSNRMRDVVRRPSLPLTAQDERDLARLRDSLPYRQVLSQLSGEEFDARTSEGAFLHAIFEAGLNSVRSAAEEVGYAILAADQEEQTDKRAIARRRPPAWAEET
jgi:hypothetical protein